MLHKILSSRIQIFINAVFVIGSLLACRHDAPSRTEEEMAYMADYESPAHKWGFINKEGQLVIKAVYDDVGPFSEGLAAVNSGGLWGYINQEGTMVIKPKFKSAWAFHENRARVQEFNQPEQFINRKGSAMPADDWSAADDFFEGIARVKLGSAFGYIDSGGLVIIQPIYTRGWNFKGGLCIVEYNEKLGVINSKGEYILKPEYDKVKLSAENKIILAGIGTTSLAFDVAGNELAHLSDSKMIDADGHLISVKYKNSMYLFSPSNKINAAMVYYSNIIYLEDSRWAGKTDEGYVLLNEEGQPLTPTHYSQINKFSTGLAAYNKGEYWGYMDKSGIEKTSDVFGLAWDYKEGLARAVFKDGIAFINSQLKLAFFPPEGTLDMRDFSEGLASVQMQ